MSKRGSASKKLLREKQARFERTMDALRSKVKVLPPPASKEGVRNV